MPTLDECHCTGQANLSWPIYSDDRSTRPELVVQK